MFIFFFVANTNVNGQYSVNSSGNSIASAGGSLSYSIGQVTCQTRTGTNASVIEGVQQPFEIYAITAIEEVNNITLSFSAYPNPATEFLQLKVETESLKDLSYQLIDINGKLLQNEKIISSQSSIIMSNLAPATYFVKVFQEKKEIKTFKIIKN